jgi:Tfp pilus assembly protein PilP
MIRLLAQLLALLVIVFGIGWATLTTLRLWQTPVALGAPTTTATPARSLQEIPDPAHPALAEFSQILARPLFFESRRLPVPQPKQIKLEPPKPSPPPPPPPPPKPVALPDKIKLLGVLMQSQTASALIETPPQAAAWHKIGDRIADWTITAIDDNRVVLRHDSARSATLPLYSESQSK